MPQTDKPGLPPQRRLKTRLRSRWHDWRWRRRMERDPSLGNIRGRATPDPDMPELAVGAVAMGEKYADWCLTMLTSLRERGGYRGPVYVITDLPRLFEQFENVLVIAVPATGRRLIAKACKQVLMHYPREPVLLYLDSDLVVTTPLSDWYRTMKPYLEHAPLLCYADNKPAKGAFHGGVVLLDCARGMPIVERWQAAVRSGRWGSDQACLYSVAGADGPGHLPATGIAFVRTLIRRGGHPDCLVHITNGAISEHPRAELLAYMADELGVTRLPQNFG